MIIYDDPNDNPDNDPEQPDRYRAELWPLIDRLLDEHRPDRYTSRSTSWMEPIIERAKEFLDGDSLEKLVTRSAVSEVIRREANAKRQAARLFRNAGQIPLGDGTDLMLEFLSDKRNLPVQINDIDVIRIGALRLEDVSELHLSREHDEKLRAEAAEFELTGISSLYELLKNTSAANLDSLF